MDDPIFEPWFVGEREPPLSEWRSPSTEWEVEAPDPGSGTEGFLRSVATARIEAISRRLRMARHRTSLEDLLAEPARLLRFELTPWLGPLAGEDPRRSALLEIGIGGDPGEPVTAWLWLDRFSEAPHEIASMPSGKLTAAWIERVIVDFVSKVLERS